MVIERLPLSSPGHDRYYDMCKLDQLPEEIYEAILEAIKDYEDRVKAVISLSRALPRTIIPQRCIYHHVILKDPSNVLKLYQHLRKRGGHASREVGWIYNLESKSWSVDAQILADLISLLPNLEVLSIDVGTTFAPEHLDEIFRVPRPNLISLNLVFRPYVETPTYYQFLKGSYFDSLLTHIASWPSHCGLKNLSIIQTLPPTVYRSHSFAQPIVFFSLQPISALATAQSLRNLTHMCLRVPERQIASFLVKGNALHQLRLLDLSTTQVTPTILSKILSRFKGLKHLILDQSGVIPRTAEMADTGEFSTLGKVCALSAVEGVKEREKEIKEATATLRARLDSINMQSRSTEDTEKSSSNGLNASTPLSKVKKGRRGVATAAFSIRDKPSTSQATQTQTRSAEAGDEKNLIDAIKILEKVRILPLKSTLRSLCVTTFTTPPSTQFAEWEVDFTRGWEEGCKTIESVQKRHFTSKKNGFIRLFRFESIEEIQRRVDGAEANHEQSPISELTGLVEVKIEDFESLIQEVASPKLCFGGMEGVAHTEECGHSIIWTQDVALQSNK